MNNKLLIGIIAVIVAFLMAGVILCGSKVLTFVNHLMLWIPLLLCIFLVWIVWKKKTSLFPDRMEPKSAKRLSKWLKVFLLVAGIPYAMFWGIVLWGSVIFDATTDESALFLIPFSFTLLFVMGFIGFLVIPVISLMKKKFKIGLIVVIIGILLIGGPLIWSNYRQIGELEYTVIELPETGILEIYAPCLMIYWDNITIYYDRVTEEEVTEEFNKPINISVYVGKAETPDDVVDKWASNVGKLKKIYIDATKRYYFYSDLYGFLWSSRPKAIQLKYRTTNEGYSRDGWYIFTASPSLFEGGYDYGEFFLSDAGVLMPAVRRSARLSCP